MIRSVEGRPELSIVVPTRNEEANVHDLLARIDAALQDVDYEVIVVDDSDDDTPTVVERERRAGRPVRMIHREGGDRSGGLSTAIVQGMAAAKGACIASLDADLQHPPEKLRDLVDALDGADLAVASRYIPGGAADGLAGPVRRLGSLGARSLAYALIPRSRLSTDPLGGFFAVRRDAIDGVELRPVGFKILLEVLARGRILRVAEVPYVFESRLNGQSKADIRQLRLYLEHLGRLRSSAPAAARQPALLRTADAPGESRVA